MNLRSHERELLGRISVGGLRRWAIFRPLAEALAILLSIPVMSWIGAGGQAARPFQASAQTSPCTPTPSNAIIQIVCTSSTYVYASDVAQLETDAVNAYLAMHGLPATDASVIYTYGRSDLRSAIRAEMVAILLGIIVTPAASRTTHQQNLYAWLQTLVWQNEISLYTNALSQFNSFQNNPCEFTLNPTIAAQYNISYNGAPFCFGSLTSLFAGPPVPAPSYFMAYGLYQSYELPSQTYPYFGTLAAQTASHLGEVAGIAGAVGGVVSAAAGVGIASGLEASLLALQSGIGGLSYIGPAIGAVSGATVNSLSVGFLSAGPAAIILITIAIGVDAGLQTFTSESNLNTLNGLSATLTQVQNTPPDLTSFVTDASGLGMFKIQSTVAAQTLPEIPSTAALPAHQNGTDLSFSITAEGSSSATITSTLNYQDWSGNTWAAQTSGGWFVETCTDATPGNCPQADSMIGSINYVDWSGVNWTASRNGATFVSTKASPASTDAPCTASSATGLTPAGTNLSACSSYASQSIPVTDNNGNHITVAFTQFSSPMFNGVTAVPFSPGTQSTQTITFTGYPTPTVCLTAGTLTSDFSLNGGQCATSGVFTIAFNGNLNATQTVYSLTFTATNSIAAVQQAVTVNVSEQLNIISPASINAAAGSPVNFTVVATGVPAPALSLYAFALPAGLSFQDNGNGTATISGTPTTPYSTACPVGPGVNCGIQATNTQGTIYQSFSVNVTGAPQANFVGPYTATFISGAPNSVMLTETGATTPVTWYLAPQYGSTPNPVVPSWLTLHDNGNGTANLMGTPPAGSSGSVTVAITPVAEGSIGVGDPYTINLSDVPFFTNASTIDFYAGRPSSFTLTPTAGTVSLVGTLPSGLTFQNNQIAGTPAAGTGGQYTLTANANAGAAGSTAQTLTLNIYEAPAFTSATTATCFTGVVCSFPVTTSGYPQVSVSRVPASYNPPTSPSQGLGMYFREFGLPADLNASYLNPQGYATGTLTISGTPSDSDAGTYQLLISANNGLPSGADQTLSLHILAATPTPAGSILATSSGLAYSRVTQTFVGTVTFKNTGGATIAGPLLVVFNGLPENVKLVNQSGLLNGVPYLSVPVTSLAPGQSGSVSVQFQNPSDGAMSYTPVIYSGGSN